ncbi:hypothetical protein C0Q70_21387 [Pomacea canaliculata]|uniref:Uncharacterized protein n=1 Tax=Pomacea canaliculata TaxID=400727 RepID=A0A2T7NCD2_POMCA|nr:hypothetical protein C0Q70_21387 [Pomacea canaliculata]
MVADPEDVVEVITLGADPVEVARGTTREVEIEAVAGLITLVTDPKDVAGVITLEDVAEMTPLVSDPEDVAIVTPLVADAEVTRAVAELEVVVEMTTPMTDPADVAGVMTVDMESEAVWLTPDRDVVAKPMTVGTEPVAVAVLVTPLTESEDIAGVIMLVTESRDGVMTKSVEDWTTLVTEDDAVTLLTDPEATAGLLTLVNDGLIISVIENEAVSEVITPATDTDAGVMNLVTDVVTVAGVITVVADGDSAAGLVSRSDDELVTPGTEPETVAVAGLSTMDTDDGLITLVTAEGPITLVTDDRLTTPVTEVTVSIVDDNCDVPGSPVDDMIETAVLPEGNSDDNDCVEERTSWVVRRVSSADDPKTTTDSLELHVGVVDSSGVCVERVWKLTPAIDDDKADDIEDGDTINGSVVTVVALNHNEDESRSDDVTGKDVSPSTEGVTALGDFEDKTCISLEVVGTSDINSDIRLDESMGVEVNKSDKVLNDSLKDNNDDISDEI